MSKIRLGIYGGTFSPPHIGHINAARSFIDGADLDKLLIMPDYTPPHKEEFGGASAEDRLNMSRLAFSSLPRTQISDFEILKGGKSYTYLTLQAFSDENTELFFLCGTDMLLSLDTWKHPEIVFSLATICYVRRESNPENDILIEEKIKLYRENFGARIIEIPHEVYAASSTELRGALSLGAVSAGVTDEVYSYILKRGLYK